MPRQYNGGVRRSGNALPLAVVDVAVGKAVHSATVHQTVAVLALIHANWRDEAALAVVLVVQPEPVVVLSRPEAQRSAAMSHPVAKVAGVVDFVGVSMPAVAGVTSDVLSQQ